MAYVLIYDPRRWVRSDSTDITIVLPLAAGGTGNTSGTATVNANLTGPVTSVGNATSITNPVDLNGDGGGIFVDSAGLKRFGIIKDNSKDPQVRYDTSIKLQFIRVLTGTVLAPLTQSVPLELGTGGDVLLGGPLKLKGYTVATLPAGVQGYLAFCIDLLAPAFGAAAVGGGAVVGPVFYTGAAWVTV